MTPRQSFAIFTATKIDVRELSLTVEQASDFIARAKAGDSQKVREELLLMGGIDKGKLPQNWASIIALADAAGREAGDSHTPKPMLVCAHANPLDDSSPVTEAHYVSEGLCGFAGVVISDGRSSFANYCRKNKLGYKNYYGGYYLPCHLYNQSFERKEKYARAYAKVLNENGIKAYAKSQLD